MRTSPTTQALNLPALYRFGRRIEPVVLLGFSRACEPLIAFRDGRIDVVNREHVQIVGWPGAMGEALEQAIEAAA